MENSTSPAVVQTIQTRNLVVWRGSVDDATVLAVLGNGRQVRIPASAFISDSNNSNSSSVVVDIPKATTSLEGIVKLATGIYKGALGVPTASDVYEYVNNTITAGSEGTNVDLVTEITEENRNSDEVAPTVKAVADYIQSELKKLMLNYHGDIHLRDEFGNTILEYTSEDKVLKIGMEINEIRMDPLRSVKILDQDGNPAWAYELES